MKVPYSVRCLKAIAVLVGGRDQLGNLLGVSHFTINGWIRTKQVPRNMLMPLVRISGNKFSVDELVGAHDE